MSLSVTYICLVSLHQLYGYSQRYIEINEIVTYDEILNMSFLSEDVIYPKFTWKKLERK